MISDVKALVEQRNPTVLDEGQEYLRQSKMGQLFVAGWRQRFELAGRLWRVTAGSFADGADPVLVTGGGAGTFCDLDQPEMLVSVGLGYYLFLAEAKVIALPAFLNAAEGQVAHILAIADRTQATASGATGTAETPDNLLDGGPVFPGYAVTAVTADITDPAMSELLAIESVRKGIVGTGVGLSDNKLTMSYEPDTPSLLAGPCTVCIYWGGSVGVGGIGSIVVGCVDSSWFPVS